MWSLLPPYLHCATFRISRFLSKLSGSFGWESNFWGYFRKLERFCFLWLGIISRWLWWEGCLGSWMGGKGGRLPWLFSSIGRRRRLMRGCNCKLWSIRRSRRNLLLRLIRARPKSIDWRFNNNSRGKSFYSWDKLLLIYKIKSTNFKLKTLILTRQYKPTKIKKPNMTKWKESKRLCTIILLH
jgi:hypothetical protein